MGGVQRRKRIAEEWTRACVVDIHGSRASLRDALNECVIGCGEFQYCRRCAVGMWGSGRNGVVRCRVEIFAAEV